jgi:hypothetical protein
MRGSRAVASETHPLGEPGWAAGVEMPSAEKLVPLARGLLSRVRLSLLFEEHPAYTPIHAIARQAGFAAELYEQARRLTEGATTIEKFASVAVPIVNRLETAIIALDRALKHVEAMRARMGRLSGFDLRRSAPATRGKQPMAISKLELRRLGDRDRLRAFRNALAHSDERVNDDQSGERLPVPRREGVSFDGHELSYADLLTMMTGLLAIADDLLEAGGADGPTRN